MAEQTVRGQLLLAQELVSGLSNFVATGGTHTPEQWVAELAELKFLIDNALATDAEANS